MRTRRWITEFCQDAGMAVRQLRRSPTFAVVAVMTLALGIGATTAVFTVVDAVLLRPLPFADPAALHLIQRQRVGGQGPAAESTYPEYRDLRDNARSFAGVAAVPSTIQPSVWTDGTNNEPLAAAMSSGNLFDVLGVRAMLGRTLAQTDDQRGADPAIVLGHGVWQRRFGGDGAVVGRRVELSGTRYTVVGVMPRG